MENKIVYNGNLVKEDQIDRSGLQCCGMYYEVLRVVGGRFAFLQDHLERLATSLNLSGIQDCPDNKLLLQDLRLCVDSNNLLDGNIRISVYPRDGHLHRLVELVPHFYPTHKEYEQGVSVAVVRFIRENPNVKKWNQNMKDVVKRFRSIHHVYEVLLFDEKNLLTEGSQSNLFFIEGDNVVTAPDDLVLKGITRDYVIKAVKALGLNLKYEAVPVADVLKYDAVFLSGTSPKVLPVREIMACCHADIGHPVLRKIMTAYDEIMLNNLT